ncbi:hypothetical protein L6452_44481 [Arctium lappa]|uniref:Uncharacterized protein n=1 Tax=Arctium lappa TaxID=4217 RepID=A0ACB8XGZ0_ARCLA|nr:hypothetical protein L6452_44481 [Arctium lappa]
MATGHHQCHCHPTHHPPPPTATCYCTVCYTTTHYSPPPPLDSPFHSTPSHLHHHLHAPPQTHLHAPPQDHHNHYPSPQTQEKHQLFQKYNQQEQVQENPPLVTPTVSSLIHRIAALESSLRRRRKTSPPPSSLRNAAARTIQTNFRAFLVRRSITLRNLKDLAYIKSSLNNLKSSISDKIHFDSHRISRESMNLLIKLDSIQGSDPMIRDGKRSISRELIRFMEFIDEISTENNLISVKNVRFSKNGEKSVILQREQKIRPSSSRVLSDNDDDERKFPQNLNNQSKKNIRVSSIPNVEEEVDEIESPRKPRNRFGALMKNQSNGKKSVSFSENGNVYRLIKSNHSHGSSDEIDSEEDEVEEIGVSSKETEVEDEDSSEMSENEMDPRKNLGTRMNHSMKTHRSDQERNEEDDDEDGFVFSAPLPEKMEYRVDSNKKKTGKQ